MSARALNWAWQQEPRNRTQKLVLAALADRADDDGIAFPSLEWIAEKCKPMSVATAKRAVADLEKQGLVAKVKRLRKGKELSTWLYRLPVDEPVKGADLRSWSRDQNGASRDHSYDLAETSTRDQTKDKADALSPQPPKRAKLAVNKPPNILFDAVAEATGANPDSEAGRIAAALNGRGSMLGIRDFVEKDFGARPPTEKDTTPGSEWNIAFREEVFRRAQLYRERWPGIDITPTALRDNWHRIATPLQRVGSGLTPEQIVALRREDL